MNKKIIYIVIFLIFTKIMHAQTSIASGQLAIIGLDTPGEDFSFVCFIDLVANTKIYFTDEEADGDYTISTSEGHLLYTVPGGGLSAGTVVTYGGNSSNFSSAAGSFALGNSGDGLLAYQGNSVGNPTTFLHAIGEDNGDLGTYPGGFSNTLTIGADDGEYNGTRSGTASELMSSINNVSNWTTSGSGVIPFTTTSFSITSTSVDDVSGFSSSIQSDTQINLSWTDNSNSDNVLLAWNSSNTFGTPSDGSTYSAGNSISGGGAVLQYSSTDSYSHTGLTSNTTYYYKVWSYDGSNYSSGTTANGTTLKSEPTNHPTNVSVTSTYQNITLTWTDAISGSQAPDGYLILGETDNSITDPSDGTAVSNDTDASDNNLAYNINHGSGASHTFSNLTASTTYYFEIFSYTNSGSNINYKSDGTVVNGNVTTGTTPSIVFNEIHYNPASSQGDDTAYEFLELYNYGSSDVDISGWTLSNGLSYTIPNSTTLSAGSYLVLAVNNSNYSGSLDWGSGGLSNAGEQITLSDGSSNVIDDLTYDDNSTWGSGADGLGSSLELISASSDNSNGSNWESSGLFGGTPGRANRSILITGDVGFRMLSSPVSGQVLGNLLTNAWTQGMTGADMTTATSNVWTFNVSGQSWTALSDISGSGTSIAAGQGFLTYIFADNNFDGSDDLPITLSVSGSENSGSATYPASGSIAADAWGLAGNPYYSTIDWDNVTKTNMTSTVYVWDDAASAYKSWNGSSGGLTNGLVAPFQGFWVQANGSGSGSITIEEADKSSSAGTFYRIADMEESGSLSLNFTSIDNKQDIAWFSFTEDGEVHKDDKDAYKLLPLAASSRLAAMSYSDESSLDINNLPFSNDQAFEVPLDVMSLEVEEGNFITIENDITVSWDIDNLPMHLEVILIDHVTGTQINIRDQYTYTFTTQPKGSFSTSYSGPVGTYPVVGEARFSLLVSYDALTNSGTIKVLPAEFALHAAYPNPFNPSTTISFDLPESGEVLLNVYDLKGALVGTLLNESKAAGTYQYKWTPNSELASGMYLFELKTKNKTRHQKITYIK